MITHPPQFILAQGRGALLRARALHASLPKVEGAEAAEVAAIWAPLFGGAGLPPHTGDNANGRPFRAPHHTVSSAGLIGGWAGKPNPGEVTLAHRGVLVLDELPEFRASAVGDLADALHAGKASLYRTLHHAGEWYHLPARPVLVICSYTDPRTVERAIRFFRWLSEGRDPARPSMLEAEGG